MQKTLFDCINFSGSFVTKFEGSRKYLSTGVLKKTEINYDELETVTFQSRPSRANINVSEGDILFAKMQNTIKVLEITKDISDLIVSTGFFVIRPKDEVDRGFLLQFLLSDTFNKQKDKHCTGATQKAVGSGGLKKIVLSLTSLSNQRKSASELDAVYGVMANQKKQHELLDELVKSKFNEMFGDPVKNDKGWTVKSIKDFSIVKIGPFGSLLHASDYIENGIPLINPSHIVDSKIVADRKLTLTSDKYKDMSAYALQRGDVILGRRGEIGRCAVVDNDKYLCGTGSIFIRIKNDYLPMVMQRIISSDAMRKKLEDVAVGITMKNLNAGMIANLQVIVPPLELQKQFAEFANGVEQSKTKLKAEITRTETLYKALMQKYFGEGGLT